MDNIKIKAVEFNKVMVNDIEFQIPPEILQGVYHNLYGEAEQLERQLIEMYNREIGKRRDIKLDYLLNRASNLI